MSETEKTLQDNSTRPDRPTEYVWLDGEPVPAVEPRAMLSASVEPSLRQSLIMADIILDLLESASLSQDEILATIDIVKALAFRSLNRSRASVMKRSICAPNLIRSKASSDQSKS